MPTHCRVNKALAVLCVAVVTSLFTSCQPASEHTGPVALSILEWRGFEKPKCHTEYLANHGGPPEFTIFAHTNDARQRMRSGDRIGKLYCVYLMRHKTVN